MCRFGNFSPFKREKSTFCGSSCRAKVGKDVYKRQVLLLVFCCWRVVSMGIVLLPTSTSNEAMITLSTTYTLSKEESYDVAGKVVQAVMAVDLSLIHIWVAGCASGSLMATV